MVDVASGGGDRAVSSRGTAMEAVQSCSCPSPRCCSHVWALMCLPIFFLHVQTSVMSQAVSVGMLVVASVGLQAEVPVVAAAALRAA